MGVTLSSLGGFHMAFGKRREPESYGVPVRSSAPAQPAPPAAYAFQNPAPSQPWAPTAPAPDGYIAAPVPAPMPAGAQYAPGASPSPPQAPEMNAYAPLQAPPPYARQGWAPPLPPGHGPGVPPPPGFAPAKSGMRKPFKIAAAVIAVLFVSGGVLNFRESRKPLQAPDSLAGYTRMTDAATEAEATALRKELESDNGGSAGVIAFYADAGGDLRVMALGLRGRTNEDKDVRDLAENGMPLNKSSRRLFGDVACYTAGTDPLAVCLWSGDVSGLVVLFDSNDLDRAAEVSREARSALH
jgi:hypothetical protein